MSKPEFKTEWESEAYDKAFDAMKELLNVANAMGSGKAVVTGMFDGFVREHRTLQQAGIKNFFEMLKEWTEQEREMTDLRNQVAFDFAKKVVALDFVFPNI
jgi:hypothetical protein